MYCVATLFQVLNKFNELIFKEFKLSITASPTLPSLAFSIFRSKYYKEEIIHQLSGQIDKDIRAGCFATGGSTDMFIPKNLEDKQIYAYDVNSLYPSVMCHNQYPVGTPTYFEKDITKHPKDAFGFFYCKITAPDNLAHPILQLHHKTDDGIRTISPLGYLGRYVFF